MIEGLGRAVGTQAGTMNRYMDNIVDVNRMLDGIMGMLTALQRPNGDHIGQIDTCLGQGHCWNTTIPPENDVCTNCGGGSGVKAWCVQCVETLCQECVEAHKRVKVTRSHTILNQRPADSPKLDSASRPRFCPVHRQEVLQLYCFTCDQLTCRDCQIMNHRNHHFQFVHEAYQSIRKQMYHVLQTVDKHTETAMKSIQDMSSR
ncbi:E3 ubiquitin-protein ligase TRIM33 [Merluccius polli]|uniref:E3 ubiquitin-protein ligase TRIM33 n=1 Tax=Merluccius polli TaxID=89951 RepID=A0AA47N4X6_MERPO|nr:E3 ubiquitin-protein ligase TRIM33 [Merluccius polli]